MLFVGSFLSASGGHRAVCEDLTERLEAAGWVIGRASAAPSRLRRLIEMLHRSFDARHAYDLAHVDVYSGPAFAWAELVARTLRFRKKPFLLTLHGGGLPEYAERSPRRVRRLLQSAWAVTVPSDFMRGAMQAYRADVKVLPNALDLAAYPFRVRSSPAPRLIWLRAFHDVYNPTLLPRVLARLVPEFPDIRALMVGRDKGDGSLSSTRRIADELAVSDRIEIRLGVKKEEVPRWLDRGDIFLNTSHVDNAPVTLIEALACGLCVVSTDVGGVSTLVSHEGDALLVPPDDPAAMADAVARFMKEPGLSERLSRAGRQRAKDFDWSVVLPEWERLLTGVSRMAA